MECKVDSNKIKILPGDFLRYGAHFRGKDLCLTFKSKCRDVELRLYESDTKEPVFAFKPDDCYRRGDVYSLMLSGRDLSGVGYRIFIGGCEYADPYAFLVSGREKWGESIGKPLCRFVKTGYNNTHKPFDLKASEMIIYNLHLRGFTMAQGGGDYKALLRRLPYLQSLGVNTLQFMPIYEFNEIISPKANLINYWGYGEDAFYMAPKASYFGEDPVKSCKAFIEKLHSRGFGVILEFYFKDRSYSDLYIQAIRHWALFYNVDGFKFLGEGVPYEAIISDPLLSDRIKLFENPAGSQKHIITEDDSFLYPLRQLQNHNQGSLHDFCNVMVRQDGGLWVNRAASTNSFTLYDAYSYLEKHNEDNGEDNRDGNNYNFSTNCGFEGETRDRSVNLRRQKALRMALLSVFLSRGIPMISAGDEAMNTAFGNNNPYCQDNETGWSVFSNKKPAKALRDYVINLIDFRKNHIDKILGDGKRPSDYDMTRLPEVSYHGAQPWIACPDEGKKAVGIMLGGCVLMLFNFHTRTESFALPRTLKDATWTYITNTAKGDFYTEGLPLQDQENILVEAKSVTLLLARRDL